MSPFFTSEQDETSGNKTTSEAVPTTEQSCPGGRFRRAGPAGSGALRDARPAASRCRFQSSSLAFAQRRGRRRCGARGDAARVPFFHGFHGADVRAWLLQIVRNTCYTWLEKNRHVKDMTEFDEDLHGRRSPSPEMLAIAGDNRQRLTRALESLSPRFRELIVLRELEGCSYKEIATIASIPIGTVMSSLSRARRQLQLALADTARPEVSHEL
jgi:RNA polymerase sigma factor (sigma-70 family)